MMLLFLLTLLVLLSCGCKGSHFLGTVMTYYPTNNAPDGEVTVVLRSKVNFRSCNDYWHAQWLCRNGTCGNVTSTVADPVDSESSGQFCQTEVIFTRKVPTNAPFELWLNGGNWVSNIVNGVILWRALTRVELRTRSDTGQANRSPQTTILPAIRIPSNCPRELKLMTFDPDGDEIKCRYGINGGNECNPCTPPSVLNLSTSCTLSFRPTNSGNQGLYAVQLVMEDFPRQAINLTQTNGEQVNRSIHTSISSIPVQFVLQVDPVVPSCTEGLYLPRFLPPTPENGAQLYVPVNQTLNLNIKAVANISSISELLFSGPHRMSENSSGPGEYTLTWTPSPSEEGQSHPVCFVVQAQAVNQSNKYHSDLRCNIVTVGDAPIINSTRPTTTVTSPPTRNPAPDSIVVLSLRISSLSSLTEENLEDVVLPQLKDQLVGMGLVSDITLRLLSIIEQ